MKTNLSIRLNSSTKNIPVVIGHGLLDEVVDFLSQHFPTHAIFAIMDSQVADLYQQAFEETLRKMARFRGVIVFPAGESQKTRKTKAILEDRLLQAGAGRDTVVLAVGGGVTGDLAGFVAATLHRGVPFLQIPTSLLAQVDAAIGGKVGVNHPAGKNLIGAFYQPEAIFVDSTFLNTLPAEEFRNGMAEVVKYAITLDPELWEYLRSGVNPLDDRRPETLLFILEHSIRAKIAVVERDEKESNYRSVLNFGHTVGHGIEHLMHYRVKHGVAIATGMRVAARISHQRFGYPPNLVEELDDLLNRLGLEPVPVRELNFQALWETICMDKKAREHRPRFTLMEKPWKPALSVPVSQEELIHAIQI